MLLGGSGEEVFEEREQVGEMVYHGSVVILETMGCIMATGEEDTGDVQLAGDLKVMKGIAHHPR